MTEPRGEEIEIPVDQRSTYLQRIEHGNPPSKITGRDDPQPGGKR